MDAASNDHAFLPLQRGRSPAEFSGYLTDALTGDAVDFIEKSDGTPLFLYLSFNAPHDPLQAPPELIRKYTHVPDPTRRIYLAMVESLDWNIGRLLDALDDQGIRGNTVVFFLSDNGGTEETGNNAPMRGYKSSYHEGGIRVPFLASWPARWPQGIVYEPPVSSMDIAATAVNLAGSPSIDPDRPLDGVNLDPYLRGEVAGEPHEALYWRGSYGIDTGVIHSGPLKLISGGWRGRRDSTIWLMMWGRRTTLQGTTDRT